MHYCHPKKKRIYRSPSPATIEAGTEVCETLHAALASLNQQSPSVNTFLNESTSTSLPHDFLDPRFLPTTTYGAAQNEPKFCPGNNPFPACCGSTTCGKCSSLESCHAANHSMGSVDGSISKLVWDLSILMMWRLLKLVESMYSLNLQMQLVVEHWCWALQAQCYLHGIACSN